MRLYIQEEETLIRFNLPSKIDGSLLFSYKSKQGLDHSINIDSKDNKWILRSNGNVNIVSNNSYIDEIELNDYMCIAISALGENNYTNLFCLPSIEETSVNYDLSQVEQITIGQDNNNTIIYKQNLMAPIHAVIKKNNEQYYIVPNNQSTYYVYVNSKRIFQPTKLYAGDVIFMNGLRIIWMSKFCKLSIQANLVQVHGLQQQDQLTVISNKDYTPISEIEENINLYNENDYFSHIPRIKSILEEKEVKVDAPPSNQNVQEDIPFLLSIGTSFSVIVMSGINAYNIGYNLSTNKTTFWESFPQILLYSSMIFVSLILPRLTKKWQKSQAEKRELKRQRKYGSYLQKKEQEIINILNNQIQIICDNNIDVRKCKQVIETKSRILWSREITDDDFLNVRLGIGNRESQLKIIAPEEKFSLDDDNLYKLVAGLREKYKYLKNVPITINFKDEIANALILTGKNKDYITNSIVTQLITYHSPLDLKLVIITDSDHEYKWDYAKYFPHCSSDDKKERFFASSQEDLKNISQYLEAQYNARKQKRREKEEENRETNNQPVESYALYDQYYLIIIDNYKLAKDSQFINRLLENEMNYGFSIVIFENSMKNLPKECHKFVCINDTESYVFSNEIRDNELGNFTAEYIIDIDMREIAKTISNIPIQGKDIELQLPTILPFLEMYNVGKVEQLNIRNRWLTSEPTQSLQAPIGVHKNGELFKLDLHEKHDGPHGLIAGMTGSGKSELIITYILSMALNYDPREVQFVLIDYKGGGLAGAFENRDQGVSIPHLAGTITNLDTAEMNRTLVSIESELTKRQKKFNEVREKTGESTMDIYKYQKLYRDGVIKEPISHLFIISDEFAELKSQQPDFMSQLISTARIGRSLGVHLILATQKPSGVVNDQIWSNSKFKICLKVQSRSDSMEMLKRPEAASLKETGRFYLQVGYDEYFDIGQSAWSGAKYNPVERIIKKQDDAITFIDNCGSIIKQSTDIYKQDINKTDYGDQLTNVVKYLQKIAEGDGFIPKKLWLPALSKNVLLNDLLKKYNYEFRQEELRAIIGEYDAPRVQEQGLLTIDLLKNGNTLIYGVPGAGKENLLTTIIYSLSISKSPQDLNIYIGDFGAETLKSFQKFPQVGDVFTIDEKNKLESFVKLLDKQLEKRKKEYSDFGGNYLEYCKLSGKKDALILTILNNFENFSETYSRQSDIFDSFFRDGTKYGMVFIVTTTAQNAVRGRVAQNFTNKICLKMPSLNDYRDLLGSPRGMIPADNYGRGLISIDNNTSYEFQTANITKIEEKTAYLIETAQKLQGKYATMKAANISVLPNMVTIENVAFELKGLDCLPIGIEKNSLEVYVYNFLENRINIIAATSLKNHIYFVYALIKQMLMLKNIKIHVIDALSIYRGNYEGIKLYQDNMESAFVTAYKNVQNDEILTQQNVYIFLGISELKERVSNKYKQHFEALFREANNCKNNTFLLFDDSENYKKIQVEEWYRNSINNTFGIWLGEDVGTQVTLGIMSLSLEDKQNVFPCIGYPVYKGNHMIVKYVVDGVDTQNEK